MRVVSGAYPIFDPGGLNAQKTVNTVKVIMSEGMHDTAIITLRQEALNAPELQPGTPVIMQYGWSTVDMDRFYGYVDHIETHYDRSLPEGSTYEDVVCLGVSYALKDPLVGSWTNVPVSRVVEEVAKKYFLATLIEEDDFPWPNLASPGSSAWTYLKQIAAKVGYTLAVNKSLLRFTSIDIGMKTQWVNMPVFNSRRSVPTYNQQSISKFQVVQGEALPIAGHTKAIRQINGLDLTSGKIVGAVNDASSLDTNLLGAQSVYPFFGQQISDTVVLNQGHAQAALAGMTQANRFPYQATATLSGLTAVKQGMPIVLQGIDTNHNGMWWVQEVTHKFDSTAYSMDVCLGRDSLGDNGTRPVHTTGMAYSPANPSNYSLTNVPATVMINKRWRAATQLNTYVSG